MKILIYTYEFPPFGSGAGVYSFELAKGLAKLNQRVIVLTSRARDGDKDKKYPFKIFRVPEGERYLKWFIGMGGFLYLLFTHRPERILITELKAQKVASVARLFFPFSYFITIHGSEVLDNWRRKRGGFKSRLVGKIIERFYRKAKKIITVSEYSKNLLVKSGLGADKISVIPNGIDKEKFSRPGNPAKIRQKLGLNREKIILTLAVLKPRKGQDMVIKALPEVIKKFPSLKYIIAGRGEDKGRLRRLVEELNLEPWIIFTDFVPEENLIDYYDLCDVFVMPSRQEGPRVEGFGIPFLEANARGKPVIGGRHGGVPEVVKDGETGILVDPYDSKAISRALIKLLEDERLRRELGQKGKKRCFALFGWDQIAQKTLNLLKGER